MARKRIRLGLIGCGGFMLNAHVPRYLDDGSVDLAGVCDPDWQQAEQVMQQWGQSIAYYADYRQMVSREKLDAVAIASPYTSGAGQEVASHFGRVVPAPSSCPVNLFTGAHPERQVGHAARRGGLRHTGLAR